MNHVRNGVSTASGFLNSPFFSTSFKNKMHWIQLTLVLTIIILSGVRIAIKPGSMPMTRSDTMAIAMGAKTIVVISYQLLTTHVSSLRRWRSLKAYLILNSLEVVFWLAVVFLTAQGMSRFCQGGYCGVSVVMVILAVIVANFSLWTAVVSQKLRREEKYAAQPELPSYQGQTQISSNKSLTHSQMYHHPTTQTIHPHT
ncbi:hypothetical protein D6D25_02012 [Aureobasidium pullulans]|nr:hypothetical protein D6D25_02012 [Aureobasidium pullulans]